MNDKINLDKMRAEIVATFDKQKEAIKAAAILRQATILREESLLNAELDCKMMECLSRAAAIENGDVELDGLLNKALVCNGLLPCFVSDCGTPLGFIRYEDISRQPMRKMSEIRLQLDCNSYQCHEIMQLPNENYIAFATRRNVKDNTLILVLFDANGKRLRAKGTVIKFSNVLDYDAKDGLLVVVNQYCCPDVEVSTIAIFGYTADDLVLLNIESSAAKEFRSVAILPNKIVVLSGDQDTPNSTFVFCLKKSDGEWIVGKRKNGPNINFDDDEEYSIIKILYAHGILFASSFNVAGEHFLEMYDPKTWLLTLRIKAPIQHVDEKHEIYETQFFFDLHKKHVLMFCPKLLAICRYEYDGQLVNVHRLVDCDDCKMTIQADCIKCNKFEEEYPRCNFGANNNVFGYSCETAIVYC